MIAEWQPIETAPRDGTPVLLTGYCFESWERYMSRCQKIAQGEFDQERNAWFLCNADWDGEEIYEPTHWMPLPEKLN